MDSGYEYSHRGTLRTAAVIVGSVAEIQRTLRTRTVKGSVLLQI
jgi:hypothetical protein